MSSTNIPNDAWNRLVAVKNSNGSEIVATYAYNALGWRVRRELGLGSGLPGTDYDYYYNSSWQVLEVDSPGGLHGAYAYEQFVWDLRYIDAPVCRLRNTTNGDDYLMDETLYYTEDANFNVTALVGTSGTVEERYNYDAYGTPHFYAADWTSRTSSIYDNDILYAGYRYDWESGLYQVRYRMLNPALGRWMQRDPLVYIDGMNFYANYAAMWGGADPTGLIALAGPPPASSPTLPRGGGGRGLGGLGDEGAIGTEGVATGEAAAEGGAEAFGGEALGPAGLIGVGLGEALKQTGLGQKLGTTIGDWGNNDQSIPSSHTPAQIRARQQREKRELEKQRKLPGQQQQPSPNGNGNGKGNGNGNGKGTGNGDNSSDGNGGSGNGNGKGANGENGPPIQTGGNTITPQTAKALGRAQK